jgi:branched-chain amino acid transport system ATP-binding protein
MSALELRGLFRHFGGVTAVEDVNFTVAAGTLTALIGPNGAGKTTLFNLITGVVSPQSGQVLLFGEDITGARAEAVARRGLIRTFQTARVFPGMTALDNVRAGGHLRLTHGLAAQALRLAGGDERANLCRAEALLELAGLAPFRDRPAAALPMGAQKLLEVCRALMAGPRLLLLDEPAAGLNDTETQDLAELLAAVRATGITVLLVEHNMALVMRHADAVVVLDLGRCIASGSPAEVVRHPRVVEAYLGVAA